ncbi:metallophosphoesterase [Advenella kashmirensis]|uniref:metallophosphoesterase n=1 Tax=Advenella kashmirensis TaxID=310575 RepID=UPI0011D23658
MTLLHTYQPIMTLPSASLDIIGDIHGEYEALRQLLGHLGYDSLGCHADRRKLVFIGDLCDRGPDSLPWFGWCGVCQCRECHLCFGQSRTKYPARAAQGWQ